MLRRAFGLSVETAFPLPGLHQRAEPNAAPPVSLELCSVAEANSSWGSDPGVEVWKTVFPEGELVTVSQRADGAQRIAFGSLAAFLLDADTRQLRCAPAVLDDPRWRRFLLDTVLWWTSARRGFFLLHCCTLRGPAGTVAFASSTGGGKTTLALELLRRDWRLVCDDVLALEVTDGRIMAHAAPGLMNAPALTPDLDALGMPLAIIGEEVWLEVDQADGTPDPLSAVVLYARGDGLDLQFKRRRATILDLVPHLWDVLGGVDRGRERFNFLGGIVDTIPIFTLSAQSRTSPKQIAGTLENALLKQTATLP